MADNYNSTMNLPKTKFDMRAGLPAKEPVMLAQWQKDDLYHKMLEANAGKPRYILHDGPPYANGDIHIGHALNKTLKDITLRYKNMSGFRAPYVPGYDTHGLPIERKAMEKVKKQAAERKPEACACGHDHGAESAMESRYGVSEFELREICRDFAQHYVDEQGKQFQRLGILGDWDHPYVTMEPDYEAAQVGVFGEMAKKGYIYKGLKPVYWCPTDRTALAEAEIEYEEEGVDSVYVAFQVKKDNGALEKAGVPVDQAWFVIWTTTTWTLPGNVAICLGPRFEYVAAKAGQRYYIVAKELLKASMEACGIQDYEVAATFTGQELERIVCDHCYLDRESLVIAGEHVTLESGTGCVHTAPGHGVEDYEVCSRFYPELPIVVPVDDDGALTAEAGPQFEGLPVFKASAVIQKALAESGHLVGAVHIEHSYPHCWRCHSPIIFRATPQWFCSVEDFKEDTYKAIDSAKWLPEWGHDRMMGMVRERSDWCISRQRLWGVPIPAFYCEDCGEYTINDETIGAVQAVFAREGSNAWYKHSAEEILPAGFKCPKCGGTHFRKERDTMDVWFDSGTSYATVLGGEKWDDQHFPADLYLEGNDQYRGWFQSSLLTSVATRGVAPYKQVVSCGMVIDEDKRKMSKSQGNGIQPADIIKDYGADIIRLWVASANYQVDVSIGSDLLKQLSEAYRKIRNTARFMLGNISDFNPDTDAVADADLQPLDRWALAECDALAATCLAGYEGFDFHRVAHNVQRFCVVSMSNFYLDIIKDRLYTTPAAGVARRAAQTAMFRILVALTKLLAPILSYTSQEIWEHVPAFAGKQPYVILHDMPETGLYTLAEGERARWDRLIAVTGDVKKVLEGARADKLIGSSLEAKVILRAGGELYDFLNGEAAQLADVFIVSQVELAQAEVKNDSGEVEGLAVEVVRADGEKCERCWQYHTDVGSDSAHPTICGRCAAVLKETGLG